MTDDLHASDLTDDVPVSPPPVPVAESGGVATPPTGAVPDTDAAANLSLDDHAEKFPKGVRHRAKSQQASPDDVPRIKELTKKLREAEAKLAAKDQPSSAPQPPAPAAVPGQTRTAAPPAQAATAEDPEPKESDPIYGGDYTKYLDARARWAGRQGYREAQAAEAKQRAAADWQASYRSRVDAARAKHADFDAVAFAPTTNIPPDSLINAWVLEADNGPEVLYALHQQPAEVERILSLAPFKQAEALALLSQRLTSPPAPPAASTASAAAPVASPVTRPPNAVRTSPMRAVDEPPGEGASLADHEKFYGHRNGRR